MLVAAEGLDSGLRLLIRAHLDEPEAARRRMAADARKSVLARHTGMARAREFVSFLTERKGVGKAGQELDVDSAA